MHVHTSALAFTAAFAMMIIGQFLQRLYILMRPETTMAKAIAILN